ncbi:RNA-binding protein [Agrobacterium phage Atu_ph07]|uniref:Clp protease-like protein n=1 Tax=Agrobacterium phage Atu_ph07 TaxID=2024264 RepID=A0A223VZW3_9CAUD|nr:RNA-binding protein [Agrobacterium phage Atu_ph07]ASV44713.1 Clp protease-like protein [Agrobacterium phage Atu_ph07]
MVDKKHVYAVDDFDKLDRFLILGTENNTMYSTGAELTKLNTDNLIQLLKLDHVKTIDRVVEVSTLGLGSKNDYCLFALAIAASQDDNKIRSYALSKLNEVARTATHLFTFLEIVKGYRGWGSALRKAVAKWYTTKNPEQLAYQVVKYRERNGWKHKDALRLSHPVAGNATTESIFRWIVGGMDAVSGTTPYVKGKVDKKVLNRADLTDYLPNIITAYEQAKTADLPRLLSLINGNDVKLPREAIPTEHLTNPAVWEALLESMPLEAMVRNIATMTRVGLLGVSKEATYKVIERLNDQEYLHKSRIHPIKMLAAYMTYVAGKSSRGSSEWVPIKEVTEALNTGFYKTFANVTPVGKKSLIALDVSGSMTTHEVGGIIGLDARTASAALALVNANVEKDVSFIGFSVGVNDDKNSKKDVWTYSQTTSRYSHNKGSIIEMEIDPSMTISQVMRYIAGFRFGGTDCSLPMLYAIDKEIPFENISVYTDNETYQTAMRADAALYRMRDRLKVDTKLAVVGMVSNEITIANPKDSGMMDFVGFSPDTPAAIADFFRK